MPPSASAALSASPPVEPPPRLLFDEKVAARLVGALAVIYPASAHVSDVGLLGASDLAIWQYARDNGFVLVSKDDDFNRLSVWLGPPPKVIGVGLGNCSTQDVIHLLQQNHN